VVQAIRDSVLAARCVLLVTKRAGRSRKSRDVAAARGDQARDTAPEQRDPALEQCPCGIRARLDLVGQSLAVKSQLIACDRQVFVASISSSAS